MEAGTKVVVTNKDGTTVKGEFISAKSGWAVVKIGKEEKKVRSSAVAPAKVPKAPKVEGEDGRLIKADLEKYVLHDTKTPAGRRHVDIDDDVAGKLREMGLPAIYKYAADVCDVSVTDLHKKYDHLNAGMQRMNLGNKIRSVFRLGDKVTEGVQKLKKAA